MFILRGARARIQIRYVNVVIIPVFYYINFSNKTPGDVFETEILLISKEYISRLFSSLCHEKYFPGTSLRQMYNCISLSFPKATSTTPGPTASQYFKRIDNL